MNDFNRQYLNLPNKDLIRIISNPRNYQPDAVAAATSILSTRIVTDEDYELAHIEDEKQERWLNMRSDFVDNWMKKIHKALIYLLIPTEKLDPRRWVILTCIILGFQYIYYGYGQFEFLWFLFFNCNDCQIDFDSIFMILLLLVTPTIIFLLLKRSIYGWGLLIANSTFNVLVALKIIFTQTGMGDYLSELILRIGLNAAILYFLFKKEVREHFMHRRSDKFENFLEEQSAERIPE